MGGGGGGGVSPPIKSKTTSSNENKLWHRDMLSFSDVKNINYQYITTEKILCKEGLDFF